MLKDFLTLLATYGPLITVLGLIIVAYSLMRWFSIKASLHAGPDDLGFQRIQRQLQLDSFTGQYHQLLEVWCIAPLNRWIGDQKQQQEIRPNGWFDRQCGIQPWTAHSYVFCLRLAFVYPILMMLLFWSLGLTPTGQLGDFVLFPETSNWERISLLISLGVEGIAFYQAIQQTGWRGWTWLLLSIVTFAIAIAIAIAIAGAVAGAFAVAVAVAVAGAFAVAVAFAVDWLLNRFDRNKPQLIIWFGYTGLLLIGITGTLSNLDLDQNSITLLVFLSLLPLLNTIWDWCSLGLTRGLLASIRLGKHPGLQALYWGLADLGFALFFLFGIVATITAALAFSNYLSIANGGTAWFDMLGLIEGIRDQPTNPEYYWLYAMFFSTLLPTLVHAFAAAASLIQIVHIPALQSWRQRAAAQLAHDRSLHIKVQAYFTAVPLIAIIAPIGLLLGLYGLFTAWGGALGHALLVCAEAIAGAVAG